MNIKPTELHVALPKIMENSIANINQQSIQKNLSEQEQQSANMAQKTEETLQKSNAVDQAPGAMIQDDGNRGRQDGGSNKKRKKQQDPEKNSASQPAADPFKGKHIDFKA